VNKYLIACLGNIGAAYSETRHNVGFKVADALAGASATPFISERYGQLATLRIKGRIVLVLKPSTYMNLSGKAVKYWMTEEKIPLENLLVVADDTALPFGKQRLRTKGSDGGHNGLKSITALLGTEAYARLRIGIGNHFGPGELVQYVLGQWTPEEAAALPERLKVAADTVLSFVLSGATFTMTHFNNK
jgi:PTH1 family peptidyl-tRNA hydrolase